MMKFTSVLFTSVFSLLMSVPVMAQSGNAAWRAQGISGANEERANTTQQQADLYREASKGAVNQTSSNIMELKANEEQEKAYKLQESSRAARNLSYGLGNN